MHCSRCYPFGPIARLGRFLDELKGEIIDSGDIDTATSAGAIGAEVEPRKPKASALDVTLVCFTSDHGDMLGDGGRWGKQVCSD